VTSCATDAFIGRQDALASKTLSPIMAPSSSADDGFLLLISVVSIALIFIAIAPGLLEQQREQLETEFATQVAGSVLKMKRRLEAGPEDPDTQIKRRNIGWDHARARNCIFMDYWGSPYPKFDDRMFERVFGVTRSIAQKILNAICISDPFFSEQPDATGKRGICPKAKLLMGLKILAFGSSPSAFIDYFQMGLTTGRKCLIHLTRFLANDAAIQSVYLRKMSRADAKRVTDMHYRQHGVIGMIGSLDCMHVFWRLCPVAWQGQQRGKEKKPSIVLEAMADYNLWIWHACFGWAGSLNDINIWDRSPKCFQVMVRRDFQFIYRLSVFNCWTNIREIVCVGGWHIPRAASGKNHHGRILKEHSEYFRESSISLFAPLSNGMLKIFQTLLFLVLFCTT